MFEEFGYGRAQIDEIAAHARIAPGAFYLSFRSKRQLLVELMRQLLATLESLTFTLGEVRGARRCMRSCALPCVPIARAAAWSKHGSRQSRPTRSYGG